MSPEVTVLALAGLLQGVQFVLMAVPANIELGTDVTLRPRDAGPLVAKLSTRVTRLVNALENHAVALALFTVAVVVVELGQANSTTTALCAWIYLAARVLYVPAYWFGWVPWRSVFWGTAFGATQLMLVIALLSGQSQ